jgi:hypothetical protein
MIKQAAFAAVIVSICLSGTAYARDSARHVCSAVAELKIEGGSEKLGISIDFFDVRAENGNARKYVLSSVYQSKLFQGFTIDRGVNWGQGKIAMKTGNSQFYVGGFKLEQQSDDSYTMVLDGMINIDPSASKKLYRVKAKLPCVNLSV